MVAYAIAFGITTAAPVRPARISARIAQPPSAMIAASKAAPTAARTQPASHRLPPAWRARSQPPREGCALHGAEQQKSVFLSFFYNHLIAVHESFGSVFYSYILQAWDQYKLWL
jgi:hypothetical protein